MKSFLAALALAVVTFSTPSFAWDVDKMNEQIEKTSVIVSGVCSGTIIDVEERLVLTAHHCITGNLREIDKEEVDPITGDIKTKRVVDRMPMFIETWTRQDFEVVTSSMHQAVIKGYDQKNDIAILQVKDKNWKPAMEASLSPNTYQYKRGLPVFAVGNPGIAFDNSVTTGIISAPERAFDMGNGLVSYFQVSAAAMGGSSGGAIYNDAGQIIGTLSGGVMGANITLAVPIAKTKELLKKIGLEKVYE